MGALACISTDEMMYCVANTTAISISILYMHDEVRSIHKNGAHLEVQDTRSFDAMYHSRPILNEFCSHNYNRNEGGKDAD